MAINSKARGNAASSHGAVSAEDSGIPSAARRSFAAIMRLGLRTASVSAASIRRSSLSSI